MIPDHKITEIYFIIDEFFKEFDNIIREHSLQDAKTVLASNNRAH